jgi:hypothetical protein
MMPVLRINKCSKIVLLIDFVHVQIDQKEVHMCAALIQSLFQ